MGEIALGSLIGCRRVSPWGIPWLARGERRGLSLGGNLDVIGILRQLDPDLVGRRTAQRDALRRSGDFLGSLTRRLGCYRIEARERTAAKRAKNSGG